MDQQNAHHKKLIIAVVLLAILVIFGWIYWHFQTRPSPETASGTQPYSFSPFNRVPLAPPAPTTTPTYASAPVVQTVTAPPPLASQPAQQYAAPAAPQQQIVDTGSQTMQPLAVNTFVLPVQSEQSSEPAPVQAEGNYMAPIPQYTSYVVVSSTPQTSQTTATGGTSGSTGFAAIDKEVFGYISGLGWTQLLGSTGQQVYDTLYDMTPNGGTSETIGQFLPGAGSTAGSGGGIGGVGGGGGGGSVSNFGGEVTKVTQCTCGPSSMLTIKDVRGNVISLEYTPGQSKLYADYNVNQTGGNALGNYTQGGECLVEDGDECDQSQGTPQGTITSIGTSQ